MFQRITTLLYKRKLQIYIFFVEEKNLHSYINLHSGDKNEFYQYMKLVYVNWKQLLKVEQISTLWGFKTVFNFHLGRNGKMAVISFTMYMYMFMQWLFQVMIQYNSVTCIFKSESTLSTLLHTSVSHQISLSANCDWMEQSAN